METLMYLTLAGVLVYLGRIGFIVYEALQMDFNFERPWPEDTSTTRLKEEFNKANAASSIIETKEINDALTYKNVVRA
ncbi:MAG: hypothetical protein WBA23_24685 [Tunicatimonas sp.]|uniref:hypothetical protein n=1 Tax=Tunicatimonas sp. TaxID=1940096 RepID=UPI003C78086C